MGLEPALTHRPRGGGFENILEKILAPCAAAWLGRFNNSWGIATTSKDTRHRQEGSIISCQVFHFSTGERFTFQPVVHRHHLWGKVTMAISKPIHEKKTKIESAENQSEQKVSPGCGCLFVIIASIIIFYFIGKNASNDYQPPPAKKEVKSPTQVNTGNQLTLIGKKCEDRDKVMAYDSANKRWLCVADKSKLDVQIHPENGTYNYILTRNVTKSGRLIGQKQYKENWPFTVPNAEVDCYYGKVNIAGKIKNLPLVIIFIDGNPYGLNGSAKDYGFIPSEAYWIKDKNKPIENGLLAIIQEGIGICKESKKQL